ncbi:MAG: glycosyl hydrolase [Bacteroidetes bacterium]|nr:MAG: glycosyl hydrolase [Bacteroidota bacterium]
MTNYWLSLTLSFLLTWITFPLNNSEQVADFHEKNPEKIKQIILKINYYERQNLWIDSLMKTMTDDQKIGQLLMVGAFPKQDEAHFKNVDEFIEKYHVGGLLIFQGSPTHQVKLTNRFQAKSKIPLLISTDAEWGLAMRMDSTILFPRAMILGAISDEKIIYDLGKEVARQCQRVGVHFNFAPVADINNNPKNPVIGTRSFGENKENVAKKSSAFMRGMQDNFVIATAKHFTGHGDTQSDSHFSLPVINHSLERLRDIEFYPFQRLINDSIKSVMVAHLHVPAIDNTKNIPTSISKKAIDILKNELGFSGLVITDALAMKGASDYKESGEIEVEAFLAGNDILLQPKNVPKAFESLKKAVQEKRILMADLEKTVRKILAAKYFVGLNNYKPLPIKNLYNDLNSPEAKILNQRIYKQAITVVKNQENLIPFQDVDSTTYASVSIGAEKNNEFQDFLGKYARFQHSAVPNKASAEVVYNQIFEQVKNKKVVIVGLHNLKVNSREDNFGITEESLKFIRKLEKVTKVVVVVFGNPYALKNFDNSKYLVAAYDDTPLARKAVPQVIFGAVSNNKARLPISASEKIREGEGFDIPFLNRLEYSFIPEESGMNSRILARIDTIAGMAIEKQATPSCQVLVVKDGKVVFHKSYGYFTYQKQTQVDHNTIYDLASVTKVTATLQAVMYLYDQGKIKLDEKISQYLPELKSTNKANVTLRNLLTHQAGLVQGSPHWWQTMKQGQYKPEFYAKNVSDSFPVKVLDDLYAKNIVEEKVWRWTVDHDLRKKRNRDGSFGYLYSDVGFYILKRLVEEMTGECLADFVDRKFYSPLGLATMGYLPLKRFSKDQIVPTEEEKFFRKTTIQGNVHDPDAALIGGVGGHAGVFSNANDLAILMQMSLQKGAYGGKRYFGSETIALFAYHRQRAESRRGLGWDKPIKGAGGPTSTYCSPLTYGHTGYTGSCVWADPTHNLVYVFLANRTYPHGGKNRKLKELGIRNLIQSAIYESLGDHRKIGGIESKKTEESEEEQ